MHIADFSFLKQEIRENLSRFSKILGWYVEGFVPLIGLRGADNSLTYFILRDKGRQRFSISLAVPPFELSLSFIWILYFKTAEMLSGASVLRNGCCLKHLWRCLFHFSYFHRDSDMLSGASPQTEGELPTVHQLSGIKITDRRCMSRIFFSGDSV